jgi:hypothetical protein
MPAMTVKTYTLLLQLTQIKITCNRALILGNITIYMEENGMVNGNVEKTFIGEIYKMSASIYFVPEGQIAQSSIVIMCQMATEGSTSPMVSDN